MDDARESDIYQKVLNKLQNCCYDLDGVQAARLAVADHAATLQPVDSKVTMAAFLRDIRQFAAKLNSIFLSSTAPAPVKQSITISSILDPSEDVNTPRPRCIFCGLSISPANFVALTQVLFDGTTKSPGKTLYHHLTCESPKEPSNG